MNNTIVSVVVITYNSAATILETLESIKNQTYQNIELIISDDASKDDTVEICRNWLKDNSSRFVNSDLITVDKNTGVAPNCNRGVSNSHGVWIKVIAGDDLLTEDGIIHYMRYVHSHPDTKILFGRLEFIGNNSEMVEVNRKHYEENLYPKFQLSQKAQLDSYLKEQYIPGPGIFYSKDLWVRIGGYDERYPMCEEDPFYTKTLLFGHRIEWVNEVCVLYRISDTSLCRSKRGLYIHSMDKSRFFNNTVSRVLIKRGEYRYVIKRCLSYIYRKYKYRYLVSGTAGDWFLNRILTYMSISYWKH